MFGISGFELLIIAAFVLVIFGPDKLPELARTASKFMRMFKSAQEDMERVIRAEMITGEPADLLSPATATASTPAAETPKPAASASAASVWAATSEDDEEEEDEE